MALTSLVKEIGAILQKLIDLDKIQNEKTKTGFDGDADGPRSDDVGRGLGATKQRKSLITRSVNPKKRKPFLKDVNNVLLQTPYQKIQKRLKI